MEEMTYRSAITRAIRQEMLNDDRVFLIGEDVAKAGGVFKTTGGLLAEFGPRRVMDTPISEQAIIGAAMGAAAAGLRPIAEIMFADFVLVTQDLVANQIAKARYMTNGQLTLPLVIRYGSGGGLRFGAQHSQSVENWMMMIPGLKVVAPVDARGRDRSLRGRSPRPRPGDVHRAQGAALQQGAGAGRRDRRRAGQGEGSPTGHGRHRSSRSA